MAPGSREAARVAHATLQPSLVEEAGITDTGSSRSSGTVRAHAAAEAALDGVLDWS